MSATVGIVVNGRGEQVPRDLSAGSYLRAKGIEPAAVVVEINLAIVRKEALESTVLRADDRVEILHFVGGG